MLFSIQLCRTISIHVCTGFVFTHCKLLGDDRPFWRLCLWWLQIWDGLYKWTPPLWSRAAVHYKIIKLSFYYYTTINFVAMVEVKVARLLHFWSQINLQQCSLFFFVFAFCFLCLLDDTNDDLAPKMQWSGNPGWGEIYSNDWDSPNLLKIIKGRECFSSHAFQFHEDGVQTITCEIVNSMETQKRQCFCCVCIQVIQLRLSLEAISEVAYVIAPTHITHRKTLRVIWVGAMT